MTPEQRMARLEAEVDRLARMLSAERGRSAQPAVDLQLHMARIQSEDPGSESEHQKDFDDIDDCGQVRVWTIRFINATFVDTLDGAVDLTPELRAATDYTAAAQADLDFIQGDVVIVCRTKNRWWIIAKVSPWNRVIVRTTQQHLKGESWNCVVYQGQKGFEVATDWSLECFNRFADLDENAFAIAEHFANGWELVAAECNVTTTTTTTTSTTTTSTSTTSTSTTTTSTTSTSTTSTSTTTTSTTTTSTTSTSTTSTSTTSTTSTTTSTTSTTTSTTSTTTSGACTGFCRWRWSAGSSTWSLINNACAISGCTTCSTPPVAPGNFDLEEQDVDCSPP